MRQLLRFLSYALPWLFARLESPKPAGETPQQFAGSTRLFPCKVGVEQRADGSWWLVFATTGGAGLPDAVGVSAAQASEITRQLLRTRLAGEE